MSCGLIDKYLLKKKNDILRYAKELENIMDIPEKKYFLDKTSLNNFLESTINYYVDHYYFDNNDNRDNPIDYANDNINPIIMSIIAFCKESNQMEVCLKYKNETFLVAVLICTASYIDISSNVVDGNYNAVHSKFKFLLNHLEKTNILKIYGHKEDAISRLFKELKERINIEKKFFKEFEYEMFKNKYKCLVDDYYEVSYEVDLNRFEKYDKKMVNKVEKKYLDEYNDVSYELLVIKILKEYISNGVVNKYLIVGNDINLKKKNSFKIFQDKIFQDHVYLLIDFEKKHEYEGYLKEVTLPIIYKYTGDGELTDNYFGRNNTILVKQELLDNNQDKIYSWQNKQINFIVGKLED